MLRATFASLDEKLRDAERTLGSVSSRLNEHSAACEELCSAFDVRVNEAWLAREKSAKDALYDEKMRNVRSLAESTRLSSQIDEIKPALKDLDTDLKNICKRVDAVAADLSS